MEAPITRHRFTVHDLDAMIQSGLIEEGSRIELIDGELIEMAAIGPKHYYCVGRLLDLLAAAKEPGDVLGVQGPIRLSMRNQPEPDLAIVRVPSAQALPTPADTLLVIEVSDTTRIRDRSKKLPLYAGAGILEAWIVDLVAERIERYTEPVGGTYQIVAPVVRGEWIESTVLPGLILDVNAVLGPPSMGNTDE